jgi:hypothetical protein
MPRFGSCGCDKNLGFGRTKSKKMKKMKKASKSRKDKSIKRFGKCKSNKKSKHCKKHRFGIVDGPGYAGDTSYSQKIGVPYFGSIEPWSNPPNWWISWSGGKAQLPGSVIKN